MIPYTSDYYLKIYSARGFHETGRFQFEKSFELTPQYQKDIDHLRPVSKLHLVLLIAYSAVILTVWWITRLSPFLESTYPLYLGMFLLPEVAVHLRHLRNVALIREVKKNDGIDGQIIYKKWFSYRISSSNCICTLHSSF
jgi:hypothetical protein